jgi:uncharacterized protein YjbI with pentapeptide repeats
VFAFQVSAYDKTDLKKVKATRDCSDCDLNSAFLSRADLNGANLRKAKLSDADLSDASLTQVKNLSINKLSEVKTLYKAKLAPELTEQVREKYPHLLEGPKLEE